MRIPPAVVVLLRAALLGLFGLLVLLQVFSLPGQFAHMAAEDPAGAHLRWPLTALAVFWVLCGQVVVVATWRLLSLSVADRIFSDVAFRWVDAVLGALGAAWVALLGLSAYVATVADDPGGPLVLLVAGAALTVVGLLVLVMRVLLRRAVVLRDELDQVI